MAINFRNKGFTYERKMARIISKWYCGDEKALWRNTNSGARATVVGKVYGGDIIPANGSITEWPLSIEIKKSEQWSIDEFVNKNPGNQLLKYMIQCLDGAEIGCNKIPLLICARNHRKPLCFLHARNPAFFMKKFDYIGRLWWRYCPVTEHRIDFYIMHLDEFFNTFTKEDFTNGEV